MLLKDGGPPWASFGVIWLSMFKLLCVFEFFLRRLVAFYPFGTRISVCTAGVTQTTCVKLDSDSYFIGIDTHTLRTLSKSKVLLQELATL